MTVAASELADDAAEALLGALLLDARAAWPDVGGVITEGDFAATEHRAIFRVIARACAEGLTPDVVTVSEQLERTGALSRLGGLAYLVELARNVPGTANASVYAGLVRERSQRAALQAMLRAGLEQIERHDASVGEVVETLTRGLADTTDRLAGQHDQSLGDALADAFMDFEERVARKEAGGIVGVTTGLQRLDRLTGGWQPGCLYVLAGLTSAGKTAASLAFTAAAARAGHPVGIVSREMLARELVSRLCSQVHGVPLRKLLGGDQHALNAVCDANAIAPMQTLPIRLDDRSAKLEEVAARITAWHRKHDVRLVVVDYLQLVTSNGDTRALEVGNVSRRLKQLAMQHRIAVLALSQFNRGAAQAGSAGERPELHHLRDSGSVEQDADAVLVLWRTQAQRAADETDQPRHLMLSLLKNRQGPTGEVYAERNPLVFEVATQRFHEHAPIPDPAPDTRRRPGAAFVTHADAATGRES